MKKIQTLLTLIFLLLSVTSAQVQKLQIHTPKIMLAGVAFDLELTLPDSENEFNGTDTTISIDGIMIRVNDQVQSLEYITFNNGRANVSQVFFENSGIFSIGVPDLNFEAEIRIIPGWLSLLPPLLAILLALLLRQVLVALFVGIWTGTTIIYDYNPIKGFFYSLTDYIGTAPADPDKMSIIVFSLTLGGMVGVLSKMGGTQGIVEKLSRYASNSKKGQLVTWLMGIFIFFDDYANTLIVGSTMRPLSDRLRISREKLSYLVDSTAAPVANIAIISTWIGFEIGLIAAAFVALGITDNAYLTFFKTIPYNFYPIFALATGLMIALLGRDFGPMYKAEQRARKTGAVLRPGATPLSSLDASEVTADETVPKRWYNGFVPIAIVILSTLIGLWLTGLENFRSSGGDGSSMGTIQYISAIIGASNSYSVLMWASFLGSFTAIGMSLVQRLLNLEQAIQAWIGGVKAMVVAALILTLAWSIGNICAEMKTADFVVEISRGYLSANFVPLLSFLTAALISFATGTSWGVMAILMPIVIPIAHILPQTDPSISAIQQQSIFLSTIASVLAGATFGDHCSPISDTTIMSSMASGADHIDHVRTQLPYALTGGLISIFLGYLPVGFGISTWIVLPLGLITIYLVVRFLGKPVDD